MPPLYSRFSDLLLLSAPHVGAEAHFRLSLLALFSLACSKIHAGAYFTGGASAALIKALTAYASQFFVEVAAHGDRQEALKRSGLYYLLQLQKFHDDKSR
jgi:hypothetical protein